MRDSEGDSPGSLRVNRRLLIIMWLWGLISLFAIGGVLYHLLRERNPFKPDAPGLPDAP